MMHVMVVDYMGYAMIEDYMSLATVEDCMRHNMLAADLMRHVVVEIF